MYYAEKEVATICHLKDIMIHISICALDKKGLM
jgi:hypothetical protein